MRVVEKSVLLLILLGSLLYADGKGVEETEVAPLDIPFDQRPLYDYMGVKVGSLGLGIEYAMPLNRHFFVRFNLNGISVNVDKTKEQIEYDVGLDLLTAGVLVDYYPMDTGSFRISAGAYYNANQLEATAAPDDTLNYDVGGNVYTGAQLGKLDGSIDFPALAPYFGLGYGGGSSTKGWGFSLDVGVLYHTSSDVEFSAESPLKAVDSAAFSRLENDMELEREDIEDDLEDFPFYPVVMLGVTYTF